MMLSQVQYWFYNWFDDILCEICHDGDYLEMASLIMVGLIFQDKV